MIYLENILAKKPTGASVVDYFIASEELLKNVVYFHVHPFLPIFSDCQSKISMSFKTSYVKKSKQNINKKMSATFKWNKVSSEKFINALQDKDMSNKIRLFMEKNHGSQEIDIDQACNVFEEIILDAAKRCLTMKNINKSKKKVNKWYDEDLYVKRRVVNAKAKSMFKNPFDNSFRTSYFKHYREYKKLVKYKKKHYTKNILGKLDELECNEPKSYWNLVNSFKK